MGLINFYAAWIGIALGFVAGAIIGIFFHDDYWAGGYVSWQRRMIRLGHISFFGLAFINLSFALSVKVYSIYFGDQIISYLFVIGAISMPIFTGKMPAGSPNCASTPESIRNDGRFKNSPVSDVESVGSMTSGTSR